MKYIVGDYNQDLIKHDHNFDRQNLIEYAQNYGFVPRPIPGSNCQTTPTLKYASKHLEIYFSFSAKI